MPRPLPTSLALAAALALAVSACGSKTTTSNATTTVAAAPTSAATPSTTAPTTADEFTTGPVPAVAYATDLKAEPKISAGTGTPSTSLVGKDLVVGTGAVVDSAATVTIRYVGALFTTGAVFDDSPWESGTPTSFSLSQVVPGFAEGLVGMHVGGRREIVIPPALGYGASAQHGIPANSTLVFVVDMVSVSG